jgi:hypothetical protein
VISRHVRIADARELGYSLRDGDPGVHELRKAFVRLKPISGRYEAAHGHLNHAGFRRVGAGGLKIEDNERAL